MVLSASCFSALSGFNAPASTGAAFSPDFSAITAGFVTDGISSLMRDGESAIRFSLPPSFRGGTTNVLLFLIYVPGRRPLGRCDGGRGCKGLGGFSRDLALSSSVKGMGSGAICFISGSPVW